MTKTTPVALVKEAQPAPKRLQLAVGRQFPFFGGGRLPEDVLTIFTRQLAALVGAGVPVHRGLALLAGQTTHPGLKNVLLQVYHQVCCGSPPSAAMMEHPNYFNPLFTSMIRVGEVHGDMPMVLKSLADYMEREMRIRRKVKQAMSYPGMVLGFTAIFALFLFNFILPYFVNIFDGMHVQLPLMTRSLMGVVRWMNDPVPAVLTIILMAALVYAVKCFIAMPEGRQMWDEFKIELPVVGELQRKIAVARFSRCMALLLSGGIHLTVALVLAGEVTANAAYEKFLAGGRNALMSGKTLNYFFEDEDVLFPVHFSRMIRVGEESGRLEQILAKLADVYDQDVEYALATFLATIEPMLVVFTGTVIGYVILAIFLPLYGFMNQI